MANITEEASQLDLEIISPCDGGSYRDSISI